MVAKGDRIGPFGILDGIGMTTVYNVTMSFGAHGRFNTLAYR